MLVVVRLGLILHLAQRDSHRSRHAEVTSGPDEEKVKASWCSEGRRRLALLTFSPFADKCHRWSSEEQILTSSRSSQETTRRRTDLGMNWEGWTDRLNAIVSLAFSTAMRYYWFLRRGKWKRTLLMHPGSQPTERPALCSPFNTDSCLKRESPRVLAASNLLFSSDGTTQ